MDISHSHLNPVKVLQKDVISTQKQPGCKKKVRPSLIWPVGKKLQNQRGQLRNGCDGIGWWQILITTIQVNCVLIPSEAGMRQHKLTRTVIIKILPSSYTITAIFWLPLWFHNFFTLAIFNWATPFLQPGFFE